MRPVLLLPAPLLALALTGCLPELPEEKAAAEGEQAGDCTDDADNDGDGAFDCDDEGCSGSEACAVAAGPPEGLAVAVTPELPEDDDDLRCAITSEAVDPNGDAVTYAYAWSVDGADAERTADTVPAAFTSVGQSWTCTVTPSDGTLTGTPASATVTILQGNRAPSAPVVAITPDAPTDDEGLTCAVVTESVDPDGDAVTYAWAWSVDGVDAGIAGESVDAARTSAGETWTCSVTASDGSATSASGSARVTVAAAPTCGDGSVTHTASGVDFVTVCAQTFEMGCTAGQSSCNADESPVMPVTLTRDYYVSQTEITQGQYQALMGTNPSSFSSCGADCPVDYLTWHEAAAYANAVSTAAGLENCYVCSGSGASVSCSVAMDPYTCEGYRLLTEAEWEGAARCGEDLLYAGSAVIDDVAWYDGNSGGVPHPPGQRDVNACGIYDMSGNVWEWVSDQYSDNYYTSSGRTDPAGASSSPYRVIRGGSWSDAAVAARVAIRNKLSSGGRSGNLGLRLARTVP